MSEVEDQDLSDEDTSVLEGLEREQPHSLEEDSMDKVDSK